MPVNIIVGLVALLVALGLYSAGTWGAFRAGAFTPRRLAYLWMGAAFDVVATVMMGLQIGGLDLRPGAPLIHTVLALLALVGMIAGAAAGTWALSAGRESAQRSISRLLVAPWAIWVGVFVWGMATRGAARLGG